jgi:hypothetical protein
VQRLVTDGGIAFDDALREVIVGALEGWWGINEEGQARGPGLTGRMRQHLGAEWHPVEALLDWTMSQAADDLTSNVRYQNRTIRQATPGLNTAIIRAHGGVANGANLSVLRPAGNTGVWRIDDSAGGSFSMSATVKGVPSDGLEWLLLRIS